MHVRPPGSPLFPYTTLFRSWGCCWSGGHVAVSVGAGPRAGTAGFVGCARTVAKGAADRRVCGHVLEAACGRCHRRCSLAGRSEEHTSELQSLTNLVCRLLLE